jgi:hypothetical protein
VHIAVDLREEIKQLKSGFSSGTNGSSEEEEEEGNFIFI